MTEENHRIDGQHHAKAVQVVWRALHEELGVPARDLAFRFDLKKHLKQHPEHKSRLMNRIERDLDTKVLDGLWMKSRFSLSELVDFYAEIIRAKES